MAFNGLQFLVKEEPRETETNDQNTISMGIKVKEEGDYLPDNPDFVELGNASDGFSNQAWKEAYYKLGPNTTQNFGANIESTGESKFNAKEWSEKYLSTFANKLHNNLLKPSISGVDSNHDNDLMESNSSEMPTRNLQHFMLNENSEDSTQDTTRTDSDQDWTEHKDGYYSCKICKIKCPDEFYLQHHFKARRLGDKSYKCCGCEKIFRDNTQLNVHSRKHTGEKPYACSVCGKKFSVNGNLSKHMRIHTGERRFECFTCERKFTQFAHLEDHIKTHSGERPYVCDFCNSAFKTKARLRKHKKSHEDERLTKRSVPCPVCMKVMKSTKQLLTHMETHDEGPHNPFPCDTCGKSYKNLFSLNIHMKVHGNVRDFQCNLCDKAFTNASHLRRHSNSHSGIRPFTCEVCMRGFPSAQNLKRHLMTHTGEKPYSCDSCDKSFLTLENLNRHKRTHTGEKPFPCNICGKFFAHSTTAKEHMRIHTGDKPFACTFCDKKFSLNKALYKHIRERHPDKFAEFKRENDLPPNMRRAREKMKRESVSIEENDIKHSSVTSGSSSPIEKTSASNKDDLKIKNEPVDDDEDYDDEDEDSKEPIEDMKYESFMDTLKLKPVDRTDIKKYENGSNLAVVKEEKVDTTGS